MNSIYLYINSILKNKYKIKCSLMQLYFAITNLSTINYAQVKDLAYPTHRNVLL